MVFEEDIEQRFDPLSWIKNRRNAGFVAGFLVGAGLGYVFDFYVIGYLLNGWLFGSLGRELATLDEFWTDDGDTAAPEVDHRE